MKRRISSILIFIIFSLCVCFGENKFFVCYASEDIPDEILVKIENILNEPSRFKDLERKTRSERKQDLIDIYKKSKGVFSYYNLYGLDIKNFRNYDDFFKGRDVTDYIVKKGAQRDHKYKNLDDKKEFAQYMQEVCPECIPKTYFFIKYGKVEDGELKGMDFVSALNTLQEGKYFCKKVDGLQGKSVYLIEKNGENIIINNGNIQLGDFLNIINSDKEFIMQERIVQHPEMAKFNPGTTNTLRIVTTKFNKDVHFLAATLRMGSSKNTVVDNARGGGTFVGVDGSTGKLFEFGYYEIVNNPREKSHPVTNVTYLGQQIPYFKEAVELVKKLHEYCYYYTSIGWDVVITESGPKVLELNAYWDVGVIQIPHGGLKQKWQELRWA